jgi:hypothetical protein
MKVSPTKEVPRGKQDVLSGKPQRLWDYFKKLIRYLTESYEDLANAINYNDKNGLFNNDLAANGGSIPEVDRQNDFSSMPLVNGDAIVESGSNNNGSYVRWANGVQMVGGIYRIGDRDSGQHKDTAPYPVSFTSTTHFVSACVTEYPDSLGGAIYTTYETIPNGESGLEVRYEIGGSYTGLGVCIHYNAWGFWK